jgi:3-hydroxy-3-methylglutaryl CoA synthase/malonyl CoA-acyl carrier protein transacylase
VFFTFLFSFSYSTAFVCGVGSTIDKNNNDIRNNGNHFTPPPCNKQKAFMKTVFSRTGVLPGQVVYHEAHGTGTLEEEHSEVDAIDAVYGEDIDRAHRLRIGCVKSNLGHAGAASGLMGLVKILVSFEDQRLYPNYDFKEPVHREIQKGNIFVVTKPTGFKNGLCAISSFGPGGANALAILAPPPQKKAWKTNGGGGHVYPFAACPTLPPKEEHDLFYAMHEELGNSSLFPYRWNDCFWKKSKPLVFVFSGQGSQWNYMGQDLLKTSRAFRHTIERLDKETGIPLVSLYEDGTKWQLTENAFIGITSFQLGVLSILKEAGLKPSFFLGHNLGEIVCGYLAGFLSEKEAMQQAKIYTDLFMVVDPDHRLDVYSVEPSAYDYLLEVPSQDKCFFVKNVREDSAIDVDNVVQSYSMRGKMIVVGCETDIIEQAIKELHLAETCVIGCHNTPINKTVSGPDDDINMLEQYLKTRYPKFFIRDLPTEHVAYHAPYLKIFKHFLKSECDKKLGTIPCGPLPTRWISTSNQNVFSSEYIINNICSPVMFHQAIEKLPSDCMVLEIGPGSGLRSLIKRTRPELERKALFELHEHVEIENILENLHYWTLMGRINSMHQSSSKTTVHYEERYPMLWTSKRNSIFVSEKQMLNKCADDEHDNVGSKRKRTDMSFLKKLGQAPHNRFEKLKHLGTPTSQIKEKSTNQNDFQKKESNACLSPQEKVIFSDEPNTLLSRNEQPFHKNGCALISPSWEPYGGPDIQRDRRDCDDLSTGSPKESKPPRNQLLSSPLSPQPEISSKDSSTSNVGCLSPLSSCSGSWRPNNHASHLHHSRQSDNDKYKAEQQTSVPSPHSTSPLPAKSKSSESPSDHFSYISPASKTSRSSGDGITGFVSPQTLTQNKKKGKDEFSLQETLLMSPLCSEMSMPIDTSSSYSSHIGIVAMESYTPGYAIKAKLVEQYNKQRKNEIHNFFSVWDSRQEDATSMVLTALRKLLDEHVDESYSMGQLHVGIDSDAATASEIKSMIGSVLPTFLVKDGESNQCAKFYYGGMAALLKTIECCRQNGQNGIAVLVDSGKLGQRAAIAVAMLIGPKPWIEIHPQIVLLEELPDAAPGNSSENYIEALDSALFQMENINSIDCSSVDAFIYHDSVPNKSHLEQHLITTLNPHGDWQTSFDQARKITNEIGPLYTTSPCIKLIGLLQSSNRTLRRLALFSYEAGSPTTLMLATIHHRRAHILDISANLSKRTLISPQTLKLLSLQQNAHGLDMRSGVYYRSTCNGKTTYQYNKNDAIVPSLTHDRGAKTTDASTCNTIAGSLAGKWSNERSYAAAALAATANWWIIAILALSDVNKPNVLGYAFNTFVASLAVYLLVQHSVSIGSISVLSPTIFIHNLLGAMSFLVYFILICISGGVFADHMYSILIGFYSFDSLAIIMQWEDIPVDFRIHSAMQHAIIFFASGIWASVSNQWPNSVSIGMCVWLTAELWHHLLNIYQQCRDYRMDMNAYALHYLQLSIFGAERFQRLAAYILLASAFRTSILAIMMFVTMVIVDCMDCFFKWKFIQTLPLGSTEMDITDNVELTSHEEDDGDIEIGQSPKYSSI